MEDKVLNKVDQFDSVGDYIAQAQTTTKENRASSHGRGRTDWYGTSSCKQAMDLVRGGWDARPDLSKLSSDISSGASAEVATQATEHQVQGAYVDVGAYLEGVPECMVAFVDQHEPKVVRVAFNIATSARMSTMAFENRGAVTLAICEKLQMAGYSVEIVAYQSVKCGLNQHTISWVVKSSTQPLDEDSLAFWCCHPSALRRIHFLYCESMEQDVQKAMGYGAWGSYGRPIKLSDHRDAEDAIKADVNVDFQVNSFDQAVREYNKLIAKLNEKLAS